MAILSMRCGKLDIGERYPDVVRELYAAENTINTLTLNRIRKTWLRPATRQGRDTGNAEMIPLSRLRSGAVTLVAGSGIDTLVVVHGAGEFIITTPRMSSRTFRSASRA